jgi:hypothetical protein
LRCGAFHPGQNLRESRQVIGISGEPPFIQ